MGSEGLNLEYSEYGLGWRKGQDKGLVCSTDGVRERGRKGLVNNMD